MVLEEEKLLEEEMLRKGGLGDEKSTSSFLE